MVHIKTKFFLLYILTLNTEAYKDIVLDSEFNKAMCESKKCLRKCCDKNEYFNSSDYSCQMTDVFLDFSNITVYDNYFKPINKTVSDLFYLIPNMFYMEIDENGSLFGNNAEDLDMHNPLTYLTESGNYYIEFKNAYERWRRIDLFCMDYVIDSDKTWIAIWSEAKIMEESDSSLNAYAFVISSVFLFIILVVYLILPGYTKLGDMILMACTFSLICAFLTFASLLLRTYDAENCIVITAITYFFLMSAFFWMNVMSMDIWWTFRSFVYARKSRRGKSIKFLIYGLYAWGISFIMSIGLVVVNQMDLTHKPWIVTPQIPREGCFLVGGQKFLYLYIPMLILIVCNWMLFLMTAFNIWRLERGVGVDVLHRASGSPGDHCIQRNRFIIYLKLSLVMGISWLLEVVGFLTPEYKIWHLSKFYNMLFGFFMFVIFVCKRKLFQKLKSRLQAFRLYDFLQRRRINSLDRSQARQNTEISILKTYTVK